MEVAILLYNGVTALDAIGPYEAFAGSMKCKIKFVAKEKGLIQLDSKMGYLHAEYCYAEVPSTDVLIVPGGIGCKELMNDEETLNWIRQLHKTSKWTTSVCSGSMVLGAAGLLEGVPATSHWFVCESLRALGAIPQEERVVHHGKIVTAAGVSSRIDMALQVVAWEFGVEIAQATQLTLEYDPKPPFDAGSVKTAPPVIVQYTKKVYTELMGSENFFVE
ncbi:DJ-1/PfpI family protein [Brevibacillus brevis]|uniref:DJ-1/PfpI family protein n=1 Tax=Brevibacillus brevis TaxID=1393 RepID=UPI0007D89862|nr:DJ-1/PfpI family protein [Brevibacillus brevis]WGV57382.1 DJ-1/PfpI family protein [Brevibacillus brevis]